METIKIEEFEKLISKRGHSNVEIKKHYELQLDGILVKRAITTREYVSVDALENFIEQKKSEPEPCCRNCDCATEGEDKYGDGFVMSCIELRRWFPKSFHCKHHKWRKEE